MILVVYSTSGKSKNIINMISVVSNYAANVVALTGEYGTEEVEKYSDVVISVPSSETTKIQEIHAIVVTYYVRKEETLLREANENIRIISGAGFIGSAVVRRAIRQGHEVLK